MPIDYETHAFRTGDGFELTLFRSPPASPDPHDRPVVLLPGAGANRYAFGLEAEHSLPGALSGAGHDVWLLEFRGSRSSRWRGEGRPPVSLDLKIQRDVPDAVAEVQRLTGADRVDMIGHSLGGLFTYLFCASGADRVGRAVTIAAPAGFRDFLGPFTPLVRRPVGLLAPMACRLPGLGIDRMARIPGPVPHLVSLRRHFRLGTSTRRVRRAWLTHATEDLPGGDLGQILEWISSGALHARSGEDYEALLPKARTPTLVLAAARDRLISHRAIREAFDRLGSEEKAFRIIGRRQGARRDYAHADLLLAPDAVHDVFPAILDWLALPAVGRRPGEAAGRGD